MPKAVGKYKVCSKCKKKKSVDKFALDNRREDGVGSWCRECKNKNRRDFTKNNPDKAKKQWRKSNLKSKYGLTLDDFDKMLETQKGVCAICGKPEIRKNQYGASRLSVDHNHKSGKIRKLLCSGCNWLVGIFETNNMNLIIDYLKENNE